MQAGSLVGLERHSQIERGYELGVEEYIILYLKFRRQTVPHLSLVLSLSLLWPYTLSSYSFLLSSCLTLQKIDRPDFKDFSCAREGNPGYRAASVYRTGDGGHAVLCRFFTLLLLKYAKHRRMPGNAANKGPSVDLLTQRMVK